MSNIVYCIGGLGTDEKIFRNLVLPGWELKHLPWLIPNEKETLEEYASRMIAPVIEENPILIGVSFGGMMSIEIARLRPVKKIILISSIKTHRERPKWMGISGKLRLHKITPSKPNKFSENLANKRLGVTNEKERDFANSYRRSVDKDYLSWSINQIVTWKNHWQPDNIVHIHGDKDQVFPIKKIKATHIVKDGTHMMVMNRAQEVSDYILASIQ
jgi:pimeloyl-ACP methyl ester carboxylesterase